MDLRVPLESALAVALVEAFRAVAHFVCGSAVRRAGRESHEIKAEYAALTLAICARCSGRLGLALRADGRQLRFKQLSR